MNSSMLRVRSLAAVTLRLVPVTFRGDGLLPRRSRPCCCLASWASPSRPACMPRWWRCRPPLDEATPRVSLGNRTGWPDRGHPAVTWSSSCPVHANVPDVVEAPTPWRATRWLKRSPSPRPRRRRRDTPAGRSPPSVVARRAPAPLRGGRASYAENRALLLPRARLGRDAGLRFRTVAMVVWPEAREVAAEGVWATAHRHRRTGGRRLRLRRLCSSPTRRLATFA